MNLRACVALLIFACCATTCALARNETGEAIEGNLSTTENVGHTEKPHGEESNCAPEHQEFDSSVRLARVEFERVQTIFVILVFIIVVVVAKMCKLVA